MIKSRALALALLPLAASSLSGCVAAAIPLVAGGAVARATTDGQPGPKVVKQEPPKLTERTELGSVVPRSGAVMTAGSPTDLAGAPDERLVPPAPRAFVEFLRYANDSADALSVGGDPVASAMLQEPASLDGKRRACTADAERPASVLIDLDPGSTVFGDGDIVPLSLSGASQGLAALRSKGITIAWISELPAADADTVRLALSRSDLDPDGSDTLLLMRYPDDRKQTRRAEFGAETCILAIVGDDRRDFDELYDYLINPDAALALHPLFNNGWFLIDDGKSRSRLSAESGTSITAMNDKPAQTQEKQEP